MNSNAGNENPIDLVDPYTGTDGNGNCLIGPYMPFGMVRLGPDSNPPHPNNGYRPGNIITRFSHTHVSGTGGSVRYGNIAITPFTGEPERRNIPPFYRTPGKQWFDALPADEIAKIGYYAVTIGPWKVRCELTSTRYTGVHRYTFPSGTSPHILLDAASCLSGRALSAYSDENQVWDSAQGNTGGWLQVLSTNEIAGRSDFRGGWGHDKSYSIYFYYMSDEPFADIALVSEGGMVPSGEGCEIIGKGIRCVLSYPECKVLNLRVGISFVSVAAARAHVEKESLHKSFEDVRKEQEREWGALLGSFKIQGGSKEQRKTFYSMLYRIFCMPTDLGIDEENPYWKSGVRQFTDYYCLWDSIRNANSFFHLFFPGLSRDFMNSLLDIAEHTGWLPDAYIANQHGQMQSACACDILFSEAAVKGIEGVDYRKALSYMKKNNEAPSPDVNVKGRYIEDYCKFGYLSTNVPKSSVSRHIEYGYNDWCIAQLAAYLGDKETAAVYLKSSEKVWNLWNDETSTFYPRKPDGSWLEGYDPWSEPRDGGNDPACYEGSAAVWSLNVFHDFYGLVEKLGGSEKFIAYLDSVFAGKLFQIKETRMHIPILYIYAGRPDLAAEHVLENLDRYSATPCGLPDNEDMGCQSGYFLWNAMGLYPVYGQRHYMLTPPLFDSIEANIGGMKKLVITAERKGSGRYIERCMLGGRFIDRAWVMHDELLKAGTIHFILSDTPNGWSRSLRPPAADF